MCTDNIYLCLASWRPCQPGLRRPTQSQVALIRHTADYLYGLTLTATSRGVHAARIRDSATARPCIGKPVFLVVEPCCFGIRAALTRSGSSPIALMFDQMGWGRCKTVAPHLMANIITAPPTCHLQAVLQVTHNMLLPETAGVEVVGKTTMLLLSVAATVVSQLSLLGRWRHQRQRQRRRHMQRLRGMAVHPERRKPRAQSGAASSRAIALGQVGTVTLSTGKIGKAPHKPHARLRATRNQRVWATAIVFLADTASFMALASTTGGGISVGAYATLVLWYGGPARPAPPPPSAAQTAARVTYAWRWPGATDGARRAAPHPCSIALVARSLYSVARGKQ